DSVKQWQPAGYLPGLKKMEVYNGGLAQVVKAATPKAEPAPADPATVAKTKTTKPKKVCRFVYLPVTGEQDLAAFGTDNPDFSDRVVEVELP
ncbi:hypothetical protein ABTA75_18995, partial [Acinetobacter baumannii]